MNKSNLLLTLHTLENALTTYCQHYCIEKEIEVLFLGSQSILFYHDNIKSDAIISSYEIDIILLFGSEHKEQFRKITSHIEIAYGNGSKLHDEEAFYIDDMTNVENIEDNTKNFPINWRSRAYTTEGKSNQKIKFTCLNKHDVAILKMIANREKDIDYVQALIQGSLLDKKTLMLSLKETESFTNLQQRNAIKKKLNYYYKLKQINVLENKKFSI